MDAGFVCFYRGRFLALVAGIGAGFVAAGLVLLFLLPVDKDMPDGHGRQTVAGIAACALGASLLAIAARRVVARSRGLPTVAGDEQGLSLRGTGVVGRIPWHDIVGAEITARHYSPKKPTFYLHVSLDPSAVTDAGRTWRWRMLGGLGPYSTPPSQLDANVMGLDRTPDEILTAVNGLRAAPHGLTGATP